MCKPAAAGAPICSIRSCLVSSRRRIIGENCEFSQISDFDPKSPDRGTEGGLRPPEDAAFFEEVLKRQSATTR
jgi:hypothetical protein